MPQKPSSLPQGLAPEYTGLNRRASIRYRCTRPIPRRMALAESFTSVDAWLVDISIKGLGLLLDRPLEKGTLVFVELEATPEAPPVEMLANVVRTTPVGLGEWVIGCDFVNGFSEEDLQAVLA
jgi:hypothetical protein